MLFFIFSGLSVLPSTLDDAQLAVQKYEELFPAFSDSREYKLMKVSAGGAQWVWACVSAALEQGVSRGICRLGLQ